MLAGEGSPESRESDSCQANQRARERIMEVTPDTYPWRGRGIVRG